MGGYVLKRGPPPPPGKPYGKRLITKILDEKLAEEPEGVAYLYPLTTNPADGFEEITYARLANAVNRAAHWIEAQIGRSPSNDGFVYLGPTDLRYTIYQLAASKSGWKLLLLSPRNSVEAQTSLLTRTAAKHFLCSANEEAKVQSIISQWKEKPAGFEIISVPEQKQLLDPEHVEPFSYSDNWEEEHKKIYLVLHTSGTTGLPKLLYMPHSYYASDDTNHLIPNAEGRDTISRSIYEGKRRFLLCLPSFHIAGVIGHTFKGVISDDTLIMPPANVPFTGDLIASLLIHGKGEAAGIPPALLDEWLAEGDKNELISSLEFIITGSGPLSKAAGEKMARLNPNFLHLFGSSECAGADLIALEDPVHDWQYFHFHPWSGIVMESAGSDGSKELFEMVVKRKVNVPELPHIQPCFQMFPELDEYRTKDLFSRHPEKPYLHKFEGRRDDVIVFSTGEKMNPVTAEGAITGCHPDVIGAMMVGQARFQPGLLIELRRELQDAAEREAFLDSIWPTIEAVNATVPAYGKISRSLVMLVFPSKPFSRTPKYTVMRRQTTNAFAAEIEDMFIKAESQFGIQSGQGIEITDVSSLQDILNGVRTAVNKQVDPSLELSDDEDLFSVGLDSQGVLQLVRSINGALQNSIGGDYAPKIQSRLVYQNGSVERLAAAIHRLVNSAGQGNTEVDLPQLASALLEKYSQDFKSETHSKLTTSWKSSAVILTGSTGSLGTYLLSGLLQNYHVEKVYCINRSIDAEQRQRKSFQEHNLGASVIDAAHKLGRVEFLHSSDLSAPQLGLITPQYERLRNQASAIIHNAWPVNFNLSLVNFESHIAGVRRLIDLCSASVRNMHFCFISSVSSASSYPKVPVPEEPLHDFNFSAVNGYGKSKQVAELLLERASEATGLSTSALRLGQIAGPATHKPSTENVLTGVWNTTEWFPSLMISSKTIGVVPESLNLMSGIDWVPIDFMAKAVLETMKTNVTATDESESNGKFGGTYNITNPTVVSYEKDLLPMIAEQMGSGVKKASFTNWVKKVQEVGVVDGNPAIKLSDFFSMVASAPPGAENLTSKWSTSRTAEASSTFKQLGPIDAAMMKRWLQGWKI